MSEKLTSFLVFVLQFVASFYDIVTLPIYFFWQKPWQARQNSWKPKGVLIAKDDNTVTYRTTQCAEKVHLELIRENITTMAEMLVYYSRKYAAKRCLGTREILDEYEEVQTNGKVFIKNHLGDYIWKTYAQVNVLSANFGMGMRELGVKSGQNVAIFAETRSEWMIAAHGLFKQNMPIVTVYANLGDDGIVHALNETKVKAIITSYQLLEKFNYILTQVPLLDTIIYIENQLMRSVEPTKLNGSKLRVLKFSDVLKLGSISSIGNNFPSARSTAIIMYTSGSTGSPKGVILSHSNLVASLRGFSDAAHSFALSEQDVLIGFLPLAHVFELIVESVCLCSGIAIGYSSAYTMIDSSTKIKQGTRGDAPVLQPTIMTAVPLILDRISKGIQEKVSKKNIFARVLFRFSYEYKRYWWNKGYDTPIINRVIFGKVTEILGGKLRLILSGGAPLAPETHERIQLCLCANVIQGYGLTESTSCATVMDRSDRTFGRVGGPTTVCDIRLQSCEDDGYTIDNKPIPCGEILVGGNNISRGYYALGDKTKEDFFVDEAGIRWFRTGDIGQMHDDGVLQIIDRKKDLLKMQAGEYISLGKIEMEMKLCKLVDNICIYGEPHEDRCVALVVPNEEQLIRFARDLNVTEEFPEVCDNANVKEHFLKVLIEHGQKRKLQRFELPVDIKICKDLWTPDNNLVTAAFKIRRKQIKEFYQMDIDRMYGTVGKNG